MNEFAVESLISRLQEIERGIARRDSLLKIIYGSLFLAAVLLFVLFPFPLSRVGSVVMVIGFGFMIWRCKRGAAVAASAPSVRRDLALVEEQIAFAQSMLFNVPFFVGANLFWMGLPGTGDGLGKALQDFAFLGGTLIVFALSYALNQQWIRKQLIPLREELSKIARSGEAT